MYPGGIARVCVIPVFTKTLSSSEFTRFTRLQKRYTRMYTPVFFDISILQFTVFFRVHFLYRCMCEESTRVHIRHSWLIYLFSSAHPCLHETTKDIYIHVNRYFSTWQLCNTLFYSIFIFCIITYLSVTTCTYVLVSGVAVRFLPSSPDTRGHKKYTYEYTPRCFQNFCIIFL